MSNIGVKKKVIILGSTGSIGTNTLSVIRKLPDLFEVEALSCRSNLAKLADQIEEFDPQAVAVAGELKDEGFKQMCDRRGVRVYQGNSGQLEMIEQIEADLVVNSITGRAPICQRQQGVDRDGRASHQGDFVEEWFDPNSRRFRTLCYLQFAGQGTETLC
jgi:1-deoxy-D-xylulose 5-phosphate reductoisomerase